MRARASSTRSRPLRCPGCGADIDRTEQPCRPLIGRGCSSARARVLRGRNARPVHAAVTPVAADWDRHVARASPAGRSSFSTDSHATPAMRETPATRGRRGASEWPRQEPNSEPGKLHVVRSSQSDPEAEDAMHRIHVDRSGRGQSRPARRSTAGGVLLTSLPDTRSRRPSLHPARDATLALVGRGGDMDSLRATADAQYRPGGRAVARDDR
jgi:hypothetical protein